MRIAFYHELHKGGARRGTNEFARRLKTRGHEVVLYTIEENDNEKYFYNKINIYKFKPKVWKGRNARVRLYKDTIELFKLFLLNKKIANEINKSHYDAVYVAASQYIESPFILRFLSSPTFFYCNDPYYRIIYEPDLFRAVNLNIFKKKYEDINRFIRKYLDKWNINKADHIVFISEFTRQMFRKVYKRDGEVIHYGVDTSHFTQYIKNKKFDLLFIGSYDFLDGYPFFMEVVKKMKTNPRVRTVIFEKEWLSEKKLLDVYRQSKILVSVSYREPLGMVPMEVMSCAIPVVAINEGGHKETILDNTTGYLVNRDASLFASKLDYLLTHNDILKKMGYNARKQMVEKWDWAIQVGKLEKFIETKIR